MNPQNLGAGNDRLRAQNVWLRIFSVVALLIALVAVSAIFKLIGSDRQTLLPPGADKPFWVSGQAVDDVYLDMWADRVASWALNVTPSNVEVNHKRILAMVVPSEYGGLEIQFKKAATKVKNDSSSTIFSPTTAKIDQERLRVAYIGTLQTWIGRVKAPDRACVYLVEFLFNKQGRLYVKTAHETSADDPFGDRDRPADAL